MLKAIDLFVDVKKETRKGEECYVGTLNSDELLKAMANPNGILAFTVSADVSIKVLKLSHITGTVSISFTAP